MVGLIYKPVAEGRIGCEDCRLCVVCIRDPFISSCCPGFKFYQKGNFQVDRQNINGTQNILKPS